MTDAEQIKFISDVLSINDDSTNPYAYFWESIWWRTDTEYSPVTFFVNCNDLFYWACADAETITPKNFPLIKQAVDDVTAAMGAVNPQDRSVPYNSARFRAHLDIWKEVGSYAADLFCARSRGMRPQQPCYKRYPKEIVPLFDAAGPVRDRKGEG